MEQYREIRSGQIITPANEYLRKLYERQPKRYEKIAADKPAATEEATEVKEAASAKTKRTRKIKSE